MFLVFDAETNGLPKNYNAPVQDLDNWPRVIQLAWILFDKDHYPSHESVLLIKPDGWKIPDEKFWIDNGFTQHESETEGVPIVDALKSFCDCVEDSETLVAHNLNFDYKIVGSEMIRAGLKCQNRPKHFCTMKETVEMCKLPGKYDSFKWPKLIELHKHLFDEGFEGAHDALIDVKACARCYFEIIKLKSIEEKS